MPGGLPCPFGWMVVRVLTEVSFGFEGGSGLHSPRGAQTQRRATTRFTVYHRPAAKWAILTRPGFPSWSKTRGGWWDLGRSAVGTWEPKGTGVASLPLHLPLFLRLPQRLE